MVLHSLDHNYSIIYNKAYGKDQPHERNRVNAETKEGKHGKRCR